MCQVYGTTSQSSNVLVLRLRSLYWKTKQINQLAFLISRWLRLKNPSVRFKFNHETKDDDNLSQKTIQYGPVFQHFKFNAVIKILLRFLLFAFPFQPLIIVISFHVHAWIEAGMINNFEPQMKANTIRFEVDIRPSSFCHDKGSTFKWHALTATKRVPQILFQ